MASWRAAPVASAQARTRRNLSRDRTRPGARRDRRTARHNHRAPRIRRAGALPGHGSGDEQFGSPDAPRFPRCVRVLAAIHHLHHRPVGWRRLLRAAGRLGRRPPGHQGGRCHHAVRRQSADLAPYHRAVRDRADEAHQGRAQTRHEADRRRSAQHRDRRLRRPVPPALARAGRSDCRRHDPHDPREWLGRRPILRALGRRWRYGAPAWRGRTAKPCTCRTARAVAARADRAGGANIRARCGLRCGLHFDRAGDVALLQPRAASG